MNKENDMLRGSEIVEINLRSMFFYILKRWKWIICLFFIGAVIGGGISYFKMEAEKPEKLVQKVAKIDVNDGVFSMERIHQVADYQKMYDAQAERDEDSFLMKMDPAYIYSATISYYVFSNEKNISVIDSILDNMLNRNNEWSALYEVSGKFCSENAFKELVTVRFEQPNYSEKINVESGDDSQSKGGVLTVFCALPDSNSRNAVHNYLDVLVIKTLEELKQSYPDGFSYELISNTEYFGFSQIVSNAIKSNAETRKTLYDSLNAQKKLLTEDEKNYYSYYYEHKSEASTAVYGFSKKNPVLGALIAAILGVLLFALFFILDRHFKENSDPILSQIPVLADIEAPSAPQKGIDRLIYNAEHSGKALLKDTDYLNRVIASKPYEKMLLAGNVADKDIRKVADNLTVYDDRLVFSGSLSSDSEAIETLQQVDAIILLVHAMKDFRTTVLKDIDIARASNKIIEGVIILR